MLLCGLVVASSGCGAGLGPGEGEGEIALSVTRDFGRTPVTGPVEVQLRPSDTVMRVLDENAEVDTSYGGRFVDAIEGIETTSSPRSRDWFYFVNGITAEIGAAEYDLEPGDSVWWDYRDWTAAMEVGAVTGSYPAPLAGEGAGRIGFSCSVSGPTCELTRERLSDDGIEILETNQPSPEGPVRVEVGTFDEVAGVDLGGEPATSGIFARFAAKPDGIANLEVLDETGATVEVLGPGSGLVAAVRKTGSQAVWVVTGTDERGVEAATSALDPDVLESTYAVVVPPDGRDPIPVPRSAGAGGA